MFFDKTASVKSKINAKKGRKNIYIDKIYIKNKYL